jgi:hypothetical protein
MSLSEVTVFRYPLKVYATGCLVLMKRFKPDFTIIVPFGDAGADRYAICAAHCRYLFRGTTQAYERRVPLAEERESLCCQFRGPSFKPQLSQRGWTAPANDEVKDAT